MQFLSLPGWAIALCIAGPVLLIVIGVFIWYVTTKNKLLGLRNDMDEAFSAMDVHMKKRYDLIPNLVETCKGYAKHESETFARVTEARSAAMAATRGQKQEAEKELSSSLRALFNKVSEAYPQLKADGQFNNLSAQLEQAEHEIAQSRKYYNAKVKIMNNKIEMFPSSFVAKRMGLERLPYFELDDMAARVAPKVSF